MRLVEELVRGVPVRCYADRPRSIVAVLEDRLGTSGGDVLLIDPALNTQVTYDAFARLVEGAAAALLARGLQPGDRVAVLLRNGLEAAVAIWACARAGLVHIGLPTGAPVARLAELLTLTGPRLVLAQPELLADARAAAGPVEVAGAELLLADEMPWRHGLARPDEDATYCLIATSGTTGRPKAVRVTGRMTCHAAVFYTGALALTAADRTAIHLPFAWVSGHVTQLAPAMLSGGSAVTMASFSAPELVAVAQAHDVTWLDVVPSIWELLLRVQAFGRASLPRVRLAVFGGAPAPPGTLGRVRERMPGLELHDVYALSETCAPVTWLADGDDRPGTVGRAAPTCELRLVGPAGALGEGAGALGEGAGELEVRGPAVTPGYWGDEPTPLTPDGWLRTGDLARIDADGFVTISGRSVDLLIRGGVNVYPAEVERALLSTGRLADAAVVGLPSPVAGVKIAAAVVLLPGTELDRPALQQAVHDALGSHAVPRRIRVVAELPRNRHGKIDRPAVAGLLDPP